MRDTVIGILAIFGLVLAYRYTSPSNPSEVAPVVSKSVTHPRTFAKGERHHEKRSNRFHVKAKVVRQDEGTSSATGSLEGISSIYPSQKRTEGIKDSDTEAGPEKKDVTLHGVPLRAWLLSERNHLNWGPLAPDEQDGMRVFVNCMELKKRGPHYAGEKDCEKLLAKDTMKPKENSEPLSLY